MLFLKVVNNLKDLHKPYECGTTQYQLDKWIREDQEKIDNQIKFIGNHYDSNFKDGDL